MNSQIVRVLFITILLTNILATSSEPELIEIPLTRTTTPHQNTSILYNLPAYIDKQHFILRVTLNDSKSWVRGKDCQLCVEGKCHQKCATKMGHSAGLNCHNKKFCSPVGPVKQKEAEIQGEEYLVTIEDTNRSQILQTSLISAKSIHKPIIFTKSNEKYDGELNLLAQSKGNSSVFTLMYPEKTPLLALGSIDKSQHIQKPSEQILAIDLETDKSVSTQSIYFQQSKIGTSGTFSRFSTFTKDLVLPQQIFSKLTSSISTSTGCKVSASALHIMTVHCTSQQLDILRNKTFTLVLNNTKITFPFESFIQNCGKENCTLSIRAARPSEGDEIIIGEIIFINFALTFDIEKHSVTFNRLNNIWGNKYENKGSSWSILHFVNVLVHYFFKVVLYSTIIAILFNLYFFKKRIGRWFIDLMTRSSKRISSVKPKRSSLSYAPALEDDISEGRPRREEFWENQIEGI